jgi:hypothetical protein
VVTLATSKAEADAVLKLRVNWFMERAMGIEPTSEAWEASILPLYDARSGANLTRISPTFRVRKEAAALVVS